MNKKRGYYVSGYDELRGDAVVASSAEEARAIVHKAGGFSGEEWIDIKSCWVRDAVVSDLPIGIVEDLSEGLKRGFHSIVEGICEHCRSEQQLELYNGAALCIACILDLGGEIK